MKNKDGKVMKKVLLILGILITFISSDTVFAENIENTDSITPAELTRLNQIEFNCKQQVNQLETRIADYTRKIDIIKNDTNKNDAQKSILIGAYERNIETLKLQQKQFEREADALTKSLLGEEKYIIYKSKQNNEIDINPNIIEK